MDLQTVRKLTETERRLDTQELPEKSSDLISPFLALPGLRAFWPLSSVDYTNPQAKDLGGGGYHLTNNNTSTFGYDPTRILVPCAFFDGTNQYLGRADGGAANWADVTGTEAYIENTAVGARGLSMGGWFRFDAAASAIEDCIGKWNDAVNNSYLIRRIASGVINFVISTDGSTDFTLASGSDTVGANEWAWLGMTFDPSARLAGWINATQYTTAASVPASIFDGNSSFGIGASFSAGAAARFMDGRASLCFLCAACLDDATVDSLFQQTRAAFGV